MDFTRQRNDDLMCAYREQLALAKYIVMPEIFEKVAESPARRFWVSEERAAVEVARMLVGKPFSRMRSRCWSRLLLTSLLSAIILKILWLCQYHAQK